MTGPFNHESKACSIPLWGSCRKGTIGSALFSTDTNAASMLPCAVVACKPNIAVLFLQYLTKDAILFSYSLGIRIWWSVNGQQSTKRNLAVRPNGHWTPLDRSHVERLVVSNKIHLWWHQVVQRKLYEFTDCYFKVLVLLSIGSRWVKIKHVIVYNWHIFSIRISITPILFAV